MDIKSPRQERLDPVPSAGSPMRVLLYSHDSFGLGHLRRNLNIAEALTTANPEAVVLIVTGSPCATHFPMPPRVDVVKLPSVTKNAEGHYVPRSLGGALDFSIELRRALLMQLFESFSPNLLIVDHQLLGLRGELIPVLKEAKRLGTRTILGIRDVIDSPEVVAREWGSKSARWALSEVYDRVCVYGTPRVFDTRVEYPVPPELSRRLEFTGYLSPKPARVAPRSLPNLRPEILVTMGGGEDGEERVLTYLDAIEMSPVFWDTTIVLGPLMPSRAVRRIKRRARILGGITVHRFHADLPKLLSNSSVVVAMAGYNTSTEIMRSGKPAVFLPRTFPRAEQHIRAERLERIGAALCLANATATQLREAIESSLTTPLKIRVQLPLDGLVRLAVIAGELVTGVTSKKTSETRIA